jgi:hypothetical protein
MVYLLQHLLSPHLLPSQYKAAYEHSVTLSSFSDPPKGKEAPKPSDEDYLVVDEDLMSKSDYERDSSMPESLYSSPSPTLALHVAPHVSQSPRVQLFSTSPSLNMPATPADSAEMGGKDDVSDRETFRDSIPPSGELTGSPPKSHAEAELVFRKMYRSHFKVLMTQLIKSYGLSLSLWCRI